MNEIKPLIFSKGEKLEVPGNFHFSLFEKGIVWFLEKGSANLFAVERKEGRAEGPRKFIAQFSADSLLFPFEEVNLQFEIVGVTEQESILWRISLKEISQFLESHPQILNPWINQLANIYGKDLISQAEEHETWEQKLLFSNTMLIKSLHERKALEEREANSLFLKLKENEEKNIHRSLVDMASVLSPLEHLKFYGGIDPLFLACQKIGSFMNISFQMPEDLPKTEDALLLISEIANFSGVRYRQVRLKGKWWKKDCGPLLCFFGDENQPVALIRKAFRSYEMIDGVSGKHSRVNEDIAKSLNPVAYVFYRNFPDELNSGKEILSFYLKHNMKDFIPFIFYGFIAALLSLATPFMIEILLNRAIPEANFSLLWQITLALFLTAISSSIFLLLRSLAFVRIEGFTSDQIQSAFWDRLLKLPVRFFRTGTSGDLISRVVSIESIRSLLSGSISRAFFSGIFSIFYLIAMAIFAPALTLIAAGLIFFAFLLSIGLAALLARKQLKFFNLQGKINSFLVQIIPSVGKLRTSGTENSAFSKWAHLFAESRKVLFKTRFLRNIMLTINYMLPFILYLFIFSYAIARNGYSAGTFLAFNAALVSFYLAMIDLSNTLLSVTPALPLWNRIKVIIKEPIEEKVEMLKPGRLTGEISIDELFFKYEENEANILENISFKVEPKEFIGIVGPSGSGKSTLMRLLIGFEKPSSGTIYFDKKDLFSLNIQEVRKQLGIVFQEEGILSGSILDNISCGGLYTDEQIERALKISGFSDDVMELPMGLHTFLSMGGSTLSGGQKQRLMITRAILPNPQILLFDEATSALDNKNQATVIDSINRLDVTRIVIAHRLSTIKHADRIYVMEKGRFVQHGTFEELASQPGLFAEMLKRQEL